VSNGPAWTREESPAAPASFTQPSPWTTRTVGEAAWRMTGPDRATPIAYVHSSAPVACAQEERSPAPSLAYTWAPSNTGVVETTPGVYGAEVQASCQQAPPPQSPLWSWPVAVPKIACMGLPAIRPGGAGAFAAGANAVPGVKLVPL